MPELLEEMRKQLEIDSAKAEGRKPDFKNMGPLPGQHFDSGDTSVPNSVFDDVVPLEVLENQEAQKQELLKTIDADDDTQTLVIVEAEIPQQPVIDEGAQQSADEVLGTTPVAEKDK